jgi:hypothetical protein
MTKPRSTRIRKGVEVIDAGRRATVIRITTLNVHGPMADLIYQDDESIGCALIADLVRADEVADLLPATVYVTVRVNSKGKPLAGMFERKYRAADEAGAAELAASNGMTRAEYSKASVTYNEDGVWTFTPGTGAPVHIRVTEYTPDDAATTAQDAAEQAEADEHEQQQLDAMGKHEESLAEITPPKYPEGTPEYAAYVAELIPELEKFARREPPYDGSTRSRCCGEPMSPEGRCENCGERGTAELQTWNDVDVVARTEQLHPGTHPYRANEVVEYVGPSGIGSWVHGPMHFRRMVEFGVAEIMTMSGPQHIEVADLRRPSTMGNIAVELTPEDVRRIFQALATERDRLTALGDRITADVFELTNELCGRFAALSN